MAQSYDTLDSVDTNGANDIADVYQLVAGEAMEAPDLCGWMSTGPLNQSYSHGGYWGRYPLEFKGHPEVWHVRCAPVGRIGKPLEQGEVRKISVLVRDSPTSKNSIVTNIKLWRRPQEHEVCADNPDLRRKERGWLTLGPIGVATRGIRMFERRATGVAQITLPAISTITRTTDDAAPRRIEPMLMMHYVLASSMIGMGELNESLNPRSCEVRYTEEEYDSACTRSAATFKRMCVAHSPHFKGSDLVRILLAAEDVCEQASFIGYLDQRADPFYIGAMQDDMHKPSGMPLMLASRCASRATPSGGACRHHAGRRFRRRRRPASSSSPRSRPYSRYGTTTQTGLRADPQHRRRVNYALAKSEACPQQGASGPGRAPRASRCNRPQESTLRSWPACTT